MPAPDALVTLSRRLGDPAEGLAILAEGNTSTSEAAAAGAFWVKASGRHLGSITSEEFVEVRSAPMLEAIRGGDFDDAAVKKLLQEARVDAKEPQMPSVETFMHAYMLSLPGVKWVGHTHPVSLLALLCLPEARALAKRRLFPDDVVCCGPESCFVPFVDPGILLAREIKSAVERYIRSHGSPPKTVWLANHGLIALGATPGEVMSASLMSEKAAKVSVALLGQDPEILSAGVIARIGGRPDEHYRQELLKQLKLG